ncbi:ABC transporter substrate-binding protein, partial [Oscillibacter sp.]|uniref:ABC transporter substrate-binding protein n=1 Tax=Oscillibacter sp. TaxID=1945593 RepID=UPI002D7FD064
FDDLMQMSWPEIEEAAKAEGEVTLSVWYNEVGFTEMLKKFEETYGIKTSLVVSEQKAFTQKALAEKDGPVGTIDVTVAGGEMVKTILDAKLMAGPLLDKMEQKDKLDPGLSEYIEGMATGGYLVPLYLNQTGFLYNSDKLSEADLPQTWEDLENYIQANPKKFGVCPADKGGSGQAFTMLAIQELVGGLEDCFGDGDVVESKITNWETVWEWFRNNSDNITFTTSNNDSASRLNQGELDLTVTWSDDTSVARKAGELGNNAKLYIPEMGLPGGGDSIGIMANAKHKAASLLLVNWFTSDEAQIMLSEQLNAIPARVDIPATNSELTPEDMEHRFSWLPVAYKTRFTQDFTPNVFK